MLNVSIVQKFSAMFFLFLVLSISIFAQNDNSVVLKLSDNDLGNLKTGIVSENPGLRKSSIELASKYSIKEVAETLLDQLKKEESPEIRILLLRALYVIGDEKYLSDIYNVAHKDKDSKVRKMASGIHLMMKVEKNLTLAEYSH